MVQIAIKAKNSHRAKVIGASEEVMKKLDEACSFEVEGSTFIKLRNKRWGWDGKTHLFGKLSGRFPTGLLSRVQSVLKENKVKFETLDERKFKTYPEAKADCLNGITLAKHQLDSLNDALKARGGILHIATNGGKTEVGAAIIKTTGALKTLWVVPTRILLKQTQERLATRLGRPVSEMGAIGNGKFEPRQITVAIASSLNPKRSRKEDRLVFAAKQNRVKEYLKTVELLIGDEVHHAGSTTWWKSLSTCTANLRYGFSGTPLDRTDNKNLLVEALCGPVVARVTNQELIDIGWSAKPVIEFYDVTKPDLSGCHFWQEAYKLGVVNNSVRNELIIQRTIREIEKKNPVLILCREIEHIRTLKNSFAARSIPSSMAHGSMPTDKAQKHIRKFIKGRTNILIGSPMFGEGVDFPGDRIRVFINAEALKAPIRTLQKIGRSVRKKTEGTNEVIVIEFADLTSKYLARHSLERLELYESEGFSIRGGTY